MRLEQGFVILSFILSNLIFFCYQAGVTFPLANAIGLNLNEGNNARTLMAYPISLVMFATSTLTIISYAFRKGINAIIRKEFIFLFILLMILLLFTSGQLQIASGELARAVNGQNPSSFLLFAFAMPLTQVCFLYHSYK